MIISGGATSRGITEEELRQVYHRVVEAARDLIIGADKILAGTTLAGAGAVLVLTGAATLLVGIGWVFIVCGGILVCWGFWEWWRIVSEELQK
jgi:hypothetical protein